MIGTIDQFVSLKINLMEIEQEVQYEVLPYGLGPLTLHKLKQNKFVKVNYTAFEGVNHAKR